MFQKTSILVAITIQCFILTMATNSTSPLNPSRTWQHYRNFLEKKGEFEEKTEEKEEPMEIPEGEKYTIVTGGAQGADAYAERLALAYECKVIIMIGPNHPRAKCISPIVPVYADLLNAQRAVRQAKKVLQRNVEVGTGGYFDELLIRNYFIAKDSYALYAFGYLESNKTKVQGGTGWTVQIAVDMGKKIYLFDLTENQWYEFIYFHLEKGSYVKVLQFQPLKSGCKLTLNHKAGIVGSRNFTETGKKQMRALFQRTFLR